MKRDFDAAALTWDADEARVRMSTAIADAMLARLHCTGEETVLDYGTGTGIIALRLAPRVRRVIAADSSRGMLDVLERKSPRPASRTSRRGCWTWSGRIRRRRSSACTRS